MPGDRPEQNERIISDTAKLYDGFVSDPVAEVDSVPWPSPSLALRVAAKGALFMHGFSPEDTDAVVDVTKKVLPGFQETDGEES